MFDKTKNKSTGNVGEDLATNYLIENKYKILERNLRLSVGEIDILAEVRGIIVIVEVKTVKGSNFGLAQDLVRFKKQNKLKLLASAISQLYPKRTLRIDIIGIDMSGDEPHIEHLENAVN
jgi:putative endonuclease